MDLALHLGMPAETLARAMTEREFVSWQRYAEHKMLPVRRIEMLLAQLAMFMDRMNGAKDKSLRDYLFDPVTDDETVDDDLEAAVDYFGFKPQARRD